DLVAPRCAGVRRFARGARLSAVERASGGARVSAQGAALTVELFTEELPPKALKHLAESFAEAIHIELVRLGFHGGDAREKSVYASPRRLALMIRNVLAVAADSKVAEKLMPAKVALDAAGQPSPALQKKLAAL